MGGLTPYEPLPKRGAMGLGRVRVELSSLQEGPPLGAMGAIPKGQTPRGQPPAGGGRYTREKASQGVIVSPSGWFP